MFQGRVHERFNLVETRNGNAQKGLIRTLAKSAVCLVNLSANGAKVAGKVPAKDF